MDAMVVAREEGTAPITLFDAFAMLPAPPDRKLPKRLKRNWNLIEPEPPVFEYDKTEIIPLFPKLDGINLPDKLKADATSSEQPKNVPNRLNGGFCLNGYPCPYGGADHCPFMRDPPIPFADFVKQFALGSTAIMEDKVDADSSRFPMVLRSEKSTTACRDSDHFSDQVTPSSVSEAADLLPAPSEMKPVFGSRYMNCSSSDSDDEQEFTPLFPELVGVNLLDKLKVDAISSEEPKHVPHQLNGGFCLNGFLCPYGGADHCPFMRDAPIPFAEFVKQFTMGTTAVIEDKVDADITQSSKAIGSEENAAGCPSYKQPNSYCAIKPKHDHFLDSVTHSTAVDAMNMRKGHHPDKIMLGADKSHMQLHDNVNCHVSEPSIESSLASLSQISLSDVEPRKPLVDFFKMARIIRSTET